MTIPGLTSTEVSQAVASMAEATLRLTDAGTGKLSEGAKNNSDSKKRELYGDFKSLMRELPLGLKNRKKRQMRLGEDA